MTAVPNFVGSDYQSQSVTVDQERLVNLFVERMESPGATSRSALYPTPGVTSIGTCATPGGRAHVVAAGREFAIYGTSCVEIDSAGVFTVRGTVAINANPATISYNGDGGAQLFITSGTNGYYYNMVTNVLTLIAALVGKATMGDFLDGYFLTLNAATSTFYISALLNGATWNTGTDFVQRSAGSDPWVSMKVAGQFVWLLGDVTSEVWYNAGTASFPFGLHPSGRVPYGCAAPFSVTNSDGTIEWLAQSSLGRGFVVRAQGFSPEVVSDYPRQTVFASYPIISDAQADSMNWNGHAFYILTFPSQQATWVHDSKQGQWFEWETWIAESGAYMSLRFRWHAMAFGEHRILDTATGSLYRLSAASGYDVESRPIRRMRRSPAILKGLQRIFYSWFELDLEPGLGVATGQGVDPQVMLRLSDDGGKTWGMERWRSAGKIGEYGKRVRWERLGAARRRVFEVVMSDPIPWRISAATMGAEAEQ